MKWYDILKSKYSIKDIDLVLFNRAGSEMKYFKDKYPNSVGSNAAAHKQLFYVGKRLIISILRHEKMSVSDRMTFKRVASAQYVNAKQSKIFSDISISGNKIIKPIFPIPLDVKINDLINFKGMGYDISVGGYLHINTEGSKLIIHEIQFEGHSNNGHELNIEIKIQKPDREIAKLIEEIRKYGYDTEFKIRTNMKYKNGTEINIWDYHDEGYYIDDNKTVDYGKIMADIRRDAVLAEPKKTLFEEKVEEDEDPRQNLWEKLQETYGDEME